MIPSFGTLFGEELPAYFTMLITAFAVCTWVAVRWANGGRFDREVMIDLSLASLVTGVAGARIAHVIFDGYLMDYVHLCTDHTLVDWHVTQGQCLSESIQGSWDAARGVCHPTQQDCFAWLRFWQGGLTWYGGMIGALAYAMHLVRKEGVPRLKVLDLGSIMLPLGLFFGRLGCWFGGCCFGQVSDSWVAVSFPSWSPASEQQWRAGLLASPDLPSLHVLPNQLFESGGSLLIALFVLTFAHPRKRFDGEPFCVSVGLYAILRFVLEFFRADDRGFYGPFTTSQWISLALLAFVAVFWTRARAFAASRRVASERDLTASFAPA